MSFYLLEIGCEEMPAAYVPASAAYVKNEFEKQLAAFGLPAKEILSGGTPRRIYLYLKELAERQADRSELIIGPPAKIAFAEDGALTEVGRKFAENKGLDISTVKKITTPKGEYLQGEKKTGGGEADAILKEIAPAIIAGMPFPKSMRWGNRNFKFARPVHWFLSLFSGKVLDFEIGGIKASCCTFGHRFLAPGKIVVKDFEQYKNALREAFVVIDEEERRKMIQEQAAALEKEGGFKIRLDEGLLETTANLVEYPHCVAGSFDKEFLELPKETLITSMKVHQKYFPVENGDGGLINKFVGVSNTPPPSGDGQIRRGYERVLRARLSDAAFFFANDRLVPLEERVESLKKVIYQEKLGSSYEKIIRFRKLAVKLAEKLAPKKSGTTEKAATLAKADLMSEMVYEFPELQGVMGSYYARLEGQPEAVCEAIYEHYLPRFAGDRLPKTDEGRFVSIADKLDTIAGAFAAGAIPTGNLDPYGLRRCAIGILAITEDAGFRLNFKELIKTALESLKEKVEFNEAETADKILNFIMQRWKQILVSKGAADGEIFDAVSGVSSDPIALMNLASVLTGARNSENFQIIAGSFKRINNILKKNSWTETGYKAELFDCGEEETLAGLIETQDIKGLLAAEKNYDALDELMKFAPAVNAFFDRVMVMAENEAVRANRLGLMAKLRSVFLSLGNFDAITLKDK